MKNTYKNRYGDIFTFTLDDHQDVLWEGNFEFYRIGMPNDYTKAYDEYSKDYEHSKNKMSFDQFKDAVHEWDDETRQYIYVKYLNMVESKKDEIDMVDPSGGPYISRGMSLDSFGFKGYVVKDFKPTETGYKIITEKCAYCGLAGGNHKISCEKKNKS